MKQDWPIRKFFRAILSIFDRIILNAETLDLIKINAVCDIMMAAFDTKDSSGIKHAMRKLSELDLKTVNGTQKRDYVVKIWNYILKSFE